MISCFESLDEPKEYRIISAKNFIFWFEGIFPPFLAHVIFFILRNGRLKFHGLLFPGMTQQCACQENFIIPSSCDSAVILSDYGFLFSFLLVVINLVLSDWFSKHNIIVLYKLFCEFRYAWKKSIPLPFFLTDMESFRIHFSAAHLPRSISNMRWRTVLCLCSCRIAVSIANIFHWKK